MTTTRTNITLTADMNNALAQVAKERGASKANLIRLAVAAWLKTEGHEVEWRVYHGGDTVSKADNGRP